MAARLFGAILDVAQKEVVSVTTEGLTRRDAFGTLVVALIVLAYVANVQDWWYLGSNRWAAVTMLVVGFVGCPLAARFEDAKSHLTPLALLGVLGVVALVFGILAVVTAAQWALVALAITVLALWVATTIRHAATPAHPLPAH
jgi:FtsH-binding integral membrane protein